MADIKSFSVLTVMAQEKKWRNKHNILKYYGNIQKKLQNFLFDNYLESICTSPLGRSILKAATVFALKKLVWYTYYTLVNRQTEVVSAVIRT